MIQKDGLNFVSLYFKIRTIGKYFVNYIWLLNSKRHLNTRQTAGCGIPSSLLALRVDLSGLRSQLSWIRLTFSSDTRGRPELWPLQRQPICSNWRFQRQMRWGMSMGQIQVWMWMWNLVLGIGLDIRNICLTRSILGSAATFLIYIVLERFIFCYYYLQVRYLFLFVSSVGLHCVQDFYVYERGLWAGC